MSSTSESTLRVAAVVDRTSAEGPGIRFAVWGAGCSVRCDGCFNPHFWSPESGQPIDAADLAARARSSGAEGVTLLGGEPFDQAKGFAEFARLVRAAGMSVMTFTGHRLVDLRNAESPEGTLDLLAVTDLLVDGPYDASSPDLDRPWVGSTNQEFHFLTDRYLHLRVELANLPDRLEVRVTPSGEIRLNGWATVDQVDALLDGEVTLPLRRGRVR